MKNKNLNQKISKAKAHYVDVLGVVPEPIRAMAQYAPEALLAYQEFKKYLYKPPAEAALDLKVKELIYVVLDTATGNLAGANNHLKAAIDQGLTQDELAEAMIQVMNVCGITTWGQTGYKVLDEAHRLLAKKKTKKNTAVKKLRQTAKITNKLNKS